MPLQIYAKEKKASSKIRVCSNPVRAYLRVLEGNEIELTYRYKGEEIRDVFISNNPEKIIKKMEGPVMVFLGDVKKQILIKPAGYYIFPSGEIWIRECYSNEIVKPGYINMEWDEDEDKED